MGRKVEYTKQQSQVIYDRGNNLLVSAGAGSGKTTVMIQRVCELIANENVPISKFLIISFTKASASDMKNKLIKKLSSLEPTAFILDQLDEILTSDVSNLHSFCARLLKAYFYEVGLDPTFIVLDQVEVDACKEKALIKLFNEKAESGDKDFYALVDIFSKSRQDTGLKNAILKLYTFLCSITNSEQWFETKLNTLYNEDLTINTGAMLLNSHMKAERDRMEKKIKECIDFCINTDSPKFVAYLQEWDTRVKALRYDGDFIENAKRLNFEQRMLNIPKAEEGKEFVKERVEELKKELADRFKKLKEYALVSDLDSISENLKITKERLSALYKLTREFEQKFKALKKEKGGLDFNDLEDYALRVLQNQTLLEEIKNKYDYIFVDEYQDINGVQEEILRLLSKENNRFMVGDVKQSIYRFRLCDPEIFLKKYDSYSNNKSAGKLVKLNANFRSKSGVLEFVNAIFDQTMSQDFGGVDYKTEARLVAGSEGQIDEKTRVEFLFADTKDLKQKEEKELEVYSVKEAQSDNQNLELQGQAEGLLIAGKIADLMANEKIKDADTGRMRKIKFSDITILTASRTQFLNKLTQTLESKGIPVSTDIEGDVNQDEYVFGIRSFIETVACYKVDYSLFSCLYSKLFDFKADELAQIKIAGAGENFFYQNVLNALESKELNIEVKQKLQSFFDCLNEFREKADFLGVREIAKQIVDRQNVVMKMGFEADSVKRLQKLNRFLNSLGQQNIYDYLNDSALAQVKCDPAYTGGAVKVMTIHKSKGLEFGIVFLVGVCRGFNFKTIYNDIVISKDLGPCIDFYDLNVRYKTPTLARQAVRLVETRKMLEEQQRLLYVALTRATDYLYIVGSGEQEKVVQSMPVSPKCFMDFMGHLFNGDIQSVNYNVVLANAKELIDADVKAEQRQVIINEGDKTLVDQMKNVFNAEYAFTSSTSVPLKTAVTTLAGQNIEGQSFALMYQEDDSVSSAEIGLVAHKIMEYLDFNVCTQSDVEKQIEEMIKVGIISKEQAELVNVQGIYKFVTNQEFTKLIRSAHKIYREREFFMYTSAENLQKEADKNDKVVVQGIIDLCLITDKGIAIVDYKTGNLSNPSTLAKYANQVNLYALAMQKSYGINVFAKFIASLKTGQFVKID